MVRFLLYHPVEGLKKNLPLKEILVYQKKEGVFFWLDFEAPRTQDFKILLENFKFHPLSIEDCRTQFHLPKVDNYQDYLFLIWHALADKPETARVETAEVDIFLGQNFLISLHQEKIPRLEEVYETYHKDSDQIARGVDWLLHTLLDSLVDDYFLLVDRLSNAIDALEDQIFEKANPEQVKKLFRCKHELLNIRKIVAPEREVISNLTRQNSSLVRRDTYVYFQDTYDHLIRVIDMVDTARDVIAGAMDIYLSTVSNHLNEIMKRLTVVATIFMPLTLITGIYGMNFRYMPELFVKGAYFGVLAFMVVLAAGMLIYFRRRGWW